MKRLIAPVVLGYMVIAIVVMLTFAPASIWPDLPFQPGTMQATLGWSLYTLALGLLAGVAGGIVAARVAGRSRRAAVLTLATLALVMGAYSAISQHGGGAAGDEPARMREPLWYSIALALAGPAAVIVGGNLRIARRDAVRTSR